MYTVYINQYAKIISVNLSGSFSELETKSCLEEFGIRLNEIVLSEYALIVDVQSLYNGTQDSAHIASKMRELVTILPFKAHLFFE